MAEAQLIDNLWATPPSAEYYWQRQSQEQDGHFIKWTNNTKHEIWFSISIVILLILCCIVHRLCKVYCLDDNEPEPNHQEQDLELVELEQDVELMELEQELEQDTSGEGGMPQWQQEQPAEATTAVDLELAQAPALVCTYQAADGWGENTCSVCLEDLVDGEALGVLPACMHYFHAECVNEWLSEHDTCPLCRGSTFVFAAIKARRHRRT